MEGDSRANRAERPPLTEMDVGGARRSWRARRCDTSDRPHRAGARRSLTLGCEGPAGVAARDVYDRMTAMDPFLRGQSQGHRRRLLSAAYSRRRRYGRRDAPRLAGSSTRRGADRRRQEAPVARDDARRNSSSLRRPRRPRCVDARPRVGCAAFWLVRGSSSLRSLGGRVEAHRHRADGARRVSDSRSARVVDQHRVARTVRRTSRSQITSVSRARRCRDRPRSRISYGRTLRQHRPQPHHHAPCHGPDSSRAIRERTRPGRNRPPACQPKSDLGEQPSGAAGTAD